MRRIPYFVIGAVLVIYGWHRYQQQIATADEVAVAAGPAARAEPAAPASYAMERPASEPGYRCDGRVYCSQMHSCEEATWFLEHCPGMKMDGDGDGIPCEDQHCGH
jgi:Excalibur calcium-binding domain